MVTTPPENAIGFVYRIKDKNTNKTLYIGKKSLYHRKKRPPLKGKKRPRISLVESDWRKYYGSSDLLTERIKQQGNEDLIREVIVWCLTKKALTYYEIKHQFLEEVLEKDTYNNNILGKFFPKDVQGVL